MYYNKFLKLSFSTILLGIFLSTASWAMDLPQEDEEHHGGRVGEESVAGEDVHVAPLRSQVNQISFSEFIGGYRATLKSLSTKSPHSYYLTQSSEYSVDESLNKEHLYPYYLCQQENDTKFLQGLKKVFPYSYYLR